LRMGKRVLGVSFIFAISSPQWNESRRRGGGVSRNFEVVRCQLLGKVSFAH
jgi:hypothetical protein